MKSLEIFVRHFFSTWIDVDNVKQKVKQKQVPKTVQENRHVPIKHLVSTRRCASPFCKTYLYLDDIFPGRWIGRRGLWEWPPENPDLTPMDNILWGSSFKTKSGNAEQLQKLIRLGGQVIKNVS